MGFIITMERYLKEPGVTEVKIPDGVTEIGYRAIPDGITSVVIPKSVTEIESRAFVDADNLLAITVDSDNPVYCDIDGVLYSKDKTVLVWYPIGRLDKKLVIPDHVTKITDINVHLYVTSVIIPKSVTEIESRAFVAADDLLSITVDSDNPVCCDIDGVLYSKDKTVLVCYPKGRQDTEFVIPDHVTEISDYAFAGCEKLSSVILHDHVTIIGENAFYSSGLTLINLPNSLKSISDGAFEHCKGLSSIDLPDSLELIGRRSFSGCNLTSINFPNGLRSIGAGAFKHCNGLTSVVIPDGVTEIHTYTFPLCKNLTSVRIPRSVTAIHRVAFNECHSLTSVEIPDSVTEIADDAFRLCERVTILTTPGSYADDYARKKGIRVSYIPLEERRNDPDTAK